ncbi:Hypothetical predicted protein [Mytilus galloprovincialis]|uniref:Farnesoic acid O-methyl transferase domain-containing protein n=1 Tax=Mytilus galloprovincialis TaxID=29158 RepID=A0A8B6G7F8_MYTGA|nr:Hypothetical predicted protein [Mytilus galloprovincialis]
MNGRIGNDEVGKPTSKNTSVVDYAISTADVLYLVENFDVLPFSSLYSDIHCPLELVLNCSNTKQSNVNINVESGENNTYIGKWNHDQVNEYKENLDKESISQLLSYIMTKTENVQNVDKNTIDEIVNEIRDVLLNSARNTFGEFVQKTYGFDYTGGKQNHRDWFNTECRRERRAFRKSKRLYKRYGSRIFKERLRRRQQLDNLWIKTLNSGNVNSYNVPDIYNYYTKLSIYDFPEITNGYLIFAIKACDNVFMLLSETYTLTSSKFLEIVIGGNSNLNSYVWLTKSPGNILSAPHYSTPYLLSCTAFQIFNLSWPSDGRFVLRNYNGMVVFDWTSGETFDIRGIGVRSGWGNDATWIINQKGMSIN